MKSDNQSIVRIFVEEMSVEVAIGLHEWERGEENRQRILVTVEWFADAVSYFEDLSSEAIIDYDQIRNAVTSWAQRPHTELIETYLEELLELSFQDERIQACCLSVSKPDVFEGTKSAGVEVFMCREDYNQQAS